ncbi:MAG TPA: N-acetylmuramoyl-L-alanine amidase, partial [Firmicutes bacterium]|nr:N-acetylmuramoyl-L-alanine amidase [Bacillota bacterium]
EAKKAPETRETVASRQGSRQKIKPESMAEAAVESKKNAGKLAGKVVVIDPGHGGYDPGAVGLSRGLEEKFVNLDTALRLKDLLGKAGAKVVLTRERDAFISLNQRVNIAHNNDAALFISIHANAHVDRTAGGTETYYNSNHLPRESLRLAELIQRELAGALNLRDMGVKNGDFYVIRATRIPSALVELAFLSNENEEGLLNRPSFRQGAAEAICRGVHRFFD